MIHLRENETVRLVIRKHWWAILLPGLTSLLLFIAPSAAAPFMRFLPPDLATVMQTIWPLFLSLYFLAAALFAFIEWMNYYLDVWIITTERVIDIDQVGLFHRVIAEFSIDKIQDISLEFNGVVETFLKFGDLKVQTAGQKQPFVIDDAPNIYRAKDLMLDLSMKKQQPAGTNP